MLAIILLDLAYHMHWRMQLFRNWLISGMQLFFGYHATWHAILAYGTLWFLAKGMQLFCHTCPPACKFFLSCMQYRMRFFKIPWVVPCSAYFGHAITHATFSTSLDFLEATLFRCYAMLLSLWHETFLSVMLVCCPELFWCMQYRMRFFKISRVVLFMYMAFFLGWIIVLRLSTIFLGLIITFKYVIIIIVDNL